MGTSVSKRSLASCHILHQRGDNESGHGLKQSLEGFVAKGNQNDFDREGLHLLRTHVFSRFPVFLSSIPMKGSFYGEADYRDSMESEVYYVALI